MAGLESTRLHPNVTFHIFKKEQVMIRYYG